MPHTELYFVAERGTYMVVAQRTMTICTTVFSRRIEAVTGTKANQPHCMIVGSTVTGTCAENSRMMVMCMMLKSPQAYCAIPSNHTSFSGTLTTTNIIMADWSKDMWQSVMNRAFRIMTNGPSALHFSSAFATVN
ncbi:hypothetical protein KIN20_020908 [Parelaphostrongylus tenuis]|uniref:Uncharacterized protein n=1 Tax=Parelaphostrongylus tenuis TaxID=148309 RepID=A0AAD5QVU5_PARTN|nr:hypothetical protein KIN20_020908 [Parelaphostrongylus tenuis]